MGFSFLSWTVNIFVHLLVLIQSIYYICTIAESYYELIFGLKLQLENDFQAKNVQYISLR